MINIYFSHLGNPLLKGIRSVSCNSGTILSIIKELDYKINGIMPFIINDNNKILSSVRIFKNVDDRQLGSLSQEPLLYESEDTVEVKDVANEAISDGENLLISIFEPKHLENLFREALAPGTKKFKYIDIKEKTQEKHYRPIIDDSDVEFKAQPIFAFKDGETTIESLKINKGKYFNLPFTDSGFIKHDSQLLPEEMVDAIKTMWDISNDGAKLRLFQEDSLFFIIAKLLGLAYPSEKTLLLSMPTGGGKTEAFMIPILSYIFKQKERESNNNRVDKRIKSIVIYPTNALANDQAKRFIELIYLLNKSLKNLREERKITIGILTGDTPNNYGALPHESLIQICPKCGNSEFAREEVNINGEKKVALRCKSNYEGHPCNHQLTYCRLTKDDILDNPPDILITNPDEINFALHSPKYARIFYKQVDSIVFDEVHMYEGIFGCHISHLLRRLEESMERKPVYIGLSATVGNAKQLASLLFNEDIKDVMYIHNKDGDYTTKKVDKMRYHAVVKPRLIPEDEDSKHYERTITTAFVMGQVLGHLITDPHFRKTIIFANYKTDSDDIAKFLKEREELDFKLFIDKIIKKWEINKPLDPEEVEIGLWIMNWYSYMKENGIANKELVEVGWNRGGLEKEARIRSVHIFSSSKIIKEKDIDSTGRTIHEREEKPIDVMVSTRTLELGIDIGDVSTVINSAAPYTTNEYVQRVGRAGRKKDSFALTIVNPENAMDAYFEKHFEEYFDGQKFEDVPIIISNKIIAERHIMARILDYTTKELCKNPESKSTFINIKEFMEALSFNDASGQVIKFYKNCNVETAKAVARHLYEKVFEKSKIGNETVLDYYLRFIKNEAIILDVEESDIDSKFIYDTLERKLVELSKHFTEGNRYWQEHEFLSGYNAKDRTMTPSLRGSGETVGLYLGEDNEKPKEVIARNMAFNTMPPNEAPASSGISTFLVYDVKGEPDIKMQGEIKKSIRQIGDKAINYFVNKFPTFPDNSEDIADYLNVSVPRDLRVRYYPDRFYCSKCKKGLTVEDIRETKFGLACKCGNIVSQLSQVYLCADKEGCGSLHEPPVLKACFNPDCSDFKAFYNEYKSNNYYLKNEMLRRFRFRLTRDLEWVCETCGTKFNFNANYKMKDNNPTKSAFIHNVVNGDWKKDDRKEPNGLAIHLKKNPEYNWDGKSKKSTFNCGECRQSSTIKPVNVPRVRTVSFSYLHRENGSICESIQTQIGQMDFTMGKSIQLASEYYRRYSVGHSKNKETKIKFRRIFEQDIYLGNFFETHMAWLKLNASVDSFINGNMKCDGNCSECEKIKQLDLGHIVAPKNKIEEYNWDDKNKKLKKPDPREKFCSKALNGECTNQSCYELSCFSNVRANFHKFVLLHTLKHAIIWALPKYAGVNISAIRGEIYPNDGTADADIVLIDTDDGGSGAIMLIQKNWSHIWNFAKEITFLAAENKANLLLPHTCSRYNHDLCPFIAADFLNSF